MKNAGFFIFIAFVILFSGCTKKVEYNLQTVTDENGYAYETYTNDPLNARIYTLENGLKVFLTVNKDEPRLQTLIGVRAGGAHDPVETTGLAHYFEHLMFKGTNKISTSDWEAEKVLLDEITELYEQHRNTDDTLQKARIYHMIDSVSALAAAFAIPNEYDKLVSSMGAKRTNAGTSLDFTVYMNDIPMNEIEKWAMLESERFSHLVLRLFHTELETVYEEFNMYQDMDRSRASEAMMEALFPNHPYGRDVIGFPKDLKNPSVKNIYAFAETFYKPNNMAIALAGDLDFEETIKILDKHFGPMEPGDIPEIVQPVEDPIEAPIVKEVFGREAENMSMAFRFNGANSKDEKYVTLIDMILSNSQAGLIDLNLNQSQLVLGAGSYPRFLKDYGMHTFYGKPREGQSLEEVKQHLLDQVEKVKAGDFDDWLLEAVINDLKLTEIKRQESNFASAFSYIDAFTKHMSYKDELTFLDELEKISKEDLMQFAKENYKDNYAVVYKRTGEPKGLIKMEKPKMTAIEINRDVQSDYYKEFAAIETPEINPVFVNFNEELSTSEITDGMDFYYVENKNNDLFYLTYIIDMGKNHNKKLPIAVNYLPFIGTNKYSPSDLRKEFFKLGIEMRVNTGNDRSYVTISGLNESFDKGIELLEHVIANASADSASYGEYVKGILKKRSDKKLDKGSILWSAMFNYGKYGQNSPFTNILEDETLEIINPSELTDIIKDMYSYRHKVYYYGNFPEDKAKGKVRKSHKMESLKDYPDPVVFTEVENTDNNVYFVDYDMVQVNIIMISKGPLMDKTLMPKASLFSEYFGGGLSSIVFQEIRESRALAYSAFAAFSAPRKADQSHYIYAFVGTQSDKMKTATDAMQDLMDNMPRAQKQYDLAKESIIKKIQTERIPRRRMFWEYMKNLDKGIDYDVRRDVFEQVGTISMDEFEGFFNEYIKDKNYNIMVLGNKENINMNELGEMGVVKELTLEEIFNY